MGGENMDEKEAMFMNTAAILRKNEMQRVTAMRKYVVAKQAQAKESPVIAREEAKGALVRTGVITKGGNPKKVIVSWE